MDGAWGLACQVLLPAALLQKSCDSTHHIKHLNFTTTIIIIICSYRYSAGIQSDQSLPVFLPMVRWWRPSWNQGRTCLWSKRRRIAAPCSMSGTRSSTLVLPMAWLASITCLCRYSKKVNTPLWVHWWLLVLLHDLWFIYFFSYSDFQCIFWHKQNITKKVITFSICKKKKNSYHMMRPCWPHY